MTTFTSPTPTISVIIPAYNAADVLPRAIRSVLGQTFRLLELIVVDDGSTDATASIAEDFAASDSRVRVVRQKNKGLGMARNAGLAVARGEYLAFVDADDEAMPDMYRRMLEAVQASGDADIVYCGHMAQDASGDWYERRDFPEPKLFQASDVPALCERFVTGMTRHPLTMAVWRALYRREVVTPFPSERDVLSEDLPFNLEAMRRARGVLFIPDTLYRYSFSPAGLARTPRPDTLRRTGRLADHLNAFFAAYGREGIGEVYYFNMLRNLRRFLLLHQGPGRKERDLQAASMMRDRRWRRSLGADVRLSRRGDSTLARLWTRIATALLSRLPSRLAIPLGRWEARIMTKRQRPTCA